MTMKSTRSRTARIVGWIHMNREATSQITPSERPKNLRIALYSNVVEKAPTIVAVPLSKLMVDRMPIRLDPKKSEGPVVLDMDLLTIANRKSQGSRSLFEIKNEGRGEVDSGAEGAGTTVIARGDAVPDVNCGEHVVDFVAFCVACCVVTDTTLRCWRGGMYGAML